MKFLKSFFKHPWIIIFFTLVITGVLGFFLKDLQMDNSTRQYFPHKTDSYQRLLDTENEFGSMVVIGASLEAGSGDIITEENIQVIRNICDRVSELSEVEEYDSLTHIDYVCESDGAISASQLIPDECWEQDPEQSGRYNYVGGNAGIMQLKERLTAWEDMYSRVLINDNGTATQMQFVLYNRTEEEKAEEMAEARRNHTKVVDHQQQTLYQIEDIIKEETAGHNLKYKIYGETVVTENSRKFMIADLKGLIPLVVIVVLITLWLSFKTLDGTLLPLITVLIATVWTCGLMAIFHETFTIVSSVIPVSLIATGSAYGIHVLTHYYIALQAVQGELTKEKYREAVFEGLADVLKAVVLAGVTTVVGFISLVSSPIKPLHGFAIYTAVGVGVSLLLAITFLPSLLLVKPLSRVRVKKAEPGRLGKKIQERLAALNGGKSSEEASGNTMYGIYRFFCGSRARLALFSACIIAFSILGLLRLKIDTAMVNYFPESSEMRQDINYVDKQFAGTNSVYFTIKGQEKGDITNPELLKAMDDLNEYLTTEHSDKVGKVISLPVFIKRINQVWFTPGAASQADSSADAGDDFGGDFDSFSSFDDEGEDAFTSSFDDDDFSSFSDDDFAGFESDDESETAEDMTNPDYVDPNIIYSQRLSDTMTSAQVLDWLNQAYVAAGGKSATPESIVKYLQREMNYNGTAYYEIPYDWHKYPTKDLQGVVNGYLQLLSGSLDRFIGKNDPLSPIETRIQCQLRTHTTESVGEIISATKRFAAEHFPEGYTIEATGTGEMEYTMTDMVVSSQISSLLISLLSVFVIITLSFRSPWAGFIGAIPLAFAILLNYMVMGFAHINLDLITSIIASVAVGVGIDYTIHFLSTYKEERSKTKDLVEVTKMTFRKSGHGIVTNAAAVGLGFLVLCFSNFSVLRYIGVLVAVVMFTSAALALNVIPGVLNIYAPKFTRPEGEEEEAK
ncbi:MAG: MMPL family transporter [Treponema sp.]|nr:MMPL family transporter [Treponema sp.]